MSNWWDDDEVVATAPEVQALQSVSHHLIPTALADRSQPSANWWEADEIIATREDDERLGEFHAKRLMEARRQDAAQATSAMPAIIREPFHAFSRGGANVMSAVTRPFSKEMADYFAETGQQIESRAEATRKDDWAPWVSRIYGGSVENLAQAGVMAPAGPYGIIGGFALSEGNQALYEAEQAGLEGNERLKYAATQGVIEGAIAAVFQRFAPGLERLIPGIASQAMQATGKQFLRSTAEEIPEELLTELGHAITEAEYGINPAAMDAEQIGKRMVDTVAQTVLTMGLAHGSAKITQNRQMIDTMKEIRSKGFVTGEEAAKLGLTPEESKNRASRKAAVDQRIEQIEQKTQQLEQETQDAGTVPGPETEVRQEPSGEDVRGQGQEQVRPEQAGQEPPAREEVQPVEEAAPEAEATDPPIPEGMTRLYHGSAEHGRYTGPAWYSTDREYAANYRENAELQYVDVPTDWFMQKADPDGYGTPTSTLELKNDEFGPRRPITPAADVTPEAGAGAPPKSGLVVAAIGADGKIYYGEPGQVHTDLMRHEAVAAGMSTNQSNDQNMGFADSTGRFLTREEAATASGAQVPEDQLGKLDATQIPAPTTPPTEPQPAEQPKRTGRKDQGAAHEVMLGEGEIATTSSGRQTSPFPKVDTSSGRKAENTVKRVDKWLWENAVAEARSRGDEFVLQQFENEDPARLPPATKYSMNEYLFGQAAAEQPAPKKTGRKDQAPKPETQQETPKKTGFRDTPPLADVLEPSAVAATAAKVAAERGETFITPFTNWSKREATEKALREAGLEPVPDKLNYWRMAAPAPQPEAAPSEPQVAAAEPVVEAPAAEPVQRERREHVVTFEKLGLKKTATGKPRPTPLIKEVASAVPEFRYDPTLVVDKNGNLVFRDGYKFTFKPEQFGLGQQRVGVDAEGHYTYENQVEPGDVVRIDLESMGIKPATEADVVAKMLEGQGFTNVKTAKGGRTVKASWKGHVIEAGQIGKEQWKAAGSSISQEAIDRANQTIERIRWSQPGDPDAGPSKGKVGPSVGSVSVNETPKEQPAKKKSTGRKKPKAEKQPAPTPMMERYQEVKREVPDSLLLFRMGDFYELFYDDAKTAAKALGLTLTTRNKGSENPVPMAGFPYHQLDGYLAKLVKQGHKAAIAEMVDPKSAKGMVKREVTRSVTPDEGEFGRDVSGVLGVAGVPISGQKSDVAKSIRHFFQRFFTSRGELPQEVYDAKVRKEGRVAKEMSHLRFVAADFRRGIGKALKGKELTQADVEKMNAVLRGEADETTVPEEVREPLRAMRDHIDALSRTLIAEGVAQGDLVGIMTENMGVYATRSYRVFDDPKWREKVPEGVRNRAISAVRAMYPDKSDADIVGIVESLLFRGAADSPSGLLKGSKLGSKDLSTFMKRQDVPRWLRDLWGEYKDAGVNYARSVFKMSHLLASHQFLNEVREAGAGKWLRTQEEGPTVGEYGELITKIAADSSSVMEPLNGMYTTPEIKAAFERLDSPGAMPEWLRVLMTVNYAVKYSKTVASSTTHIRNTISNTGFAVGNGHWRLDKAGKALWATTTGTFNLPDAEFRAYYERAAELGLVGEDVRAGELKDALRDASQANIDEFLYNAPARQATKMVRAGRAGIRFLNSLYQAEDVVWKLYAWENEKARYQKAHPKWSEDRVEKRAAEIVRDTYPTYSKIPEAIRGVRRFPLVGTFVSFPSEVVRTTFHTIELGLKEMRAPETRAIGAQRLAGTVAAVGALSILSRAMMALLGIGDDEDDDLRWFVPPWQENSRFIYTSKPEDATYRFVDLGYSDPHAYLTDSAIAFMRGDNWHNGLLDALTEFLRPFASEDILAKTLMDVRSNEDQEVYNSNDSAGEQAKDIIAYVWQKALEPGTISSLRRIKTAVEGTDPRLEVKTEVLTMTTGQRLQKVDVEHSLGFRIREFSKALTNIQNIARKTATSQGTATGEMVATDVARMEKLRLAEFSQMQRIVGAARRLGVSEDAIRAMLRGELRDSVADDVISGDYSPYEMTPQTVQQMLEANPSEFQERFDAWHDSLGEIYDE